MINDTEDEDVTIVIYDKKNDHVIAIRHLPNGDLSGSYGWSNNRYNNFEGKKICIECMEEGVLFKTETKEVHVFDNKHRYVIDKQGNVRKEIRENCKSIIIKP